MCKPVDRWGAEASWRKWEGVEKKDIIVTVTALLPFSPSSSAQRATSLGKASACLRHAYQDVSLWRSLTGRSKLHVSQMSCPQTLSSLTFYYVVKPAFIMMVVSTKRPRDILCVRSPSRCISIPNNNNETLVQC